MSVHSLTLRGTALVVEDESEAQSAVMRLPSLQARTAMAGPGALRRSLARTELVLANLTTVIGRQLAPGDLPSVLAC